MVERKAEGELREVVKSLRDRSFKYVEREEKKIDWHAYNESQLDDLHFFVEQTKSLVDTVSLLLPISEPAVGRPSKQASDVAKAVLLMEYLQVSERGAAGWVWIFKEKLGITEDLSPRTIGRGFENPEVLFILTKVFELTTIPFAQVEQTIAIDGTGVAETVKQNYESVKNQDITKTSDWLKLSIVTGVELHGIVSYSLDRHTHDTKLFEPLVNQAANRWPNANRLTADAGYLSRANAQTASNLGLTPFLFPKVNVTLKQRGSAAWTTMLKLLLANVQQWLEWYHLRSNVETVNSCLVRRFRKLSCVKTQTKLAEEFTRLILHNLRQLNTALHEHKITLNYAL